MKRASHRRAPTRRDTAPAHETRTFRDWVVAGIAALVPVLVYWPILGAGFLLDDFVLFQTSPSLDDWRSIPRGFVLDIGAVRKGADTVISSYYRPVFLALSTLYHHWVGGAPQGWHAASLVLAALIGGLVALFLLRLGWEPALAGLGSIAFSLHPSHVSSVAWASGLQDLLAAFFVVLTLLVVVSSKTNGARRDGLVAIGFVLALLSKEVSIGLVAFVGAWAFVDGKLRREDRRHLARLTAVMSAVAFAYVLVRLAVFRGLADPPYSAPGVASTLWSLPVALAAYLEMLVWPFRFSMFRPERPLLGPQAPFGAAAVIVGGVGLALGFWLRRKPERLLPLAWAAAWLLPALNLWALDAQWMVTDRYLFLPVLALPWVLVLAVPRRAAIAALGAASVVFALATSRYAAIFKDERAFIAAMEVAEPTSPTVFAEKGRLLREAGDIPGALAALGKAIALDPKAPAPLTGLGDLERERGDFENAKRHYEAALVVRPYASRPFKWLAIDLAQAGQRPRAVAIMEEAAQRWPDDFEVQLLDALLLDAEGNHERARVVFARAERLRPNDPGVAGGLDAVAARVGPMFERRTR